MVRIIKFLDIRSRNTIYNSFILVEFNYCPLVWYSSAKTNNDQLEKKNHQRALRIQYQDYNSTYDDLLLMVGTNVLLILRLLLMALWVSKSLNSLNIPPVWMIDLPRNVCHIKCETRVLQSNRNAQLLRSDYDPSHIPVQSCGMICPIILKK